MIRLEEALNAKETNSGVREKASDSNNDIHHWI